MDSVYRFLRENAVLGKLATKPFYYYFVGEFVGLRDGLSIIRAGLLLNVEWAFI
jgi:hypothetical protein